MGTRGLYGIRLGNADKCTYNHWDSYPACLGRKILYFCATHSEEQIIQLYNLIKLVDEKNPPTENQKKICIDKGYYNGYVGEKTPDDWYCLLRNLQGNIDAWDKAIEKDVHIYMIDNVDFIKDSLFCEYAYIINLDTHCLEFWQGFQKEPSEDNRYGTGTIDGYYPCKLFGEYLLENITKDEIQSIVMDMEGLYK